jgi:hypothetical protein
MSESGRSSRRSCEFQKIHACQAYGTERTATDSLWLQSYMATEMSDTSAQIHLNATGTQGLGSSACEGGNGPPKLRVGVGNGVLYVSVALRVSFPVAGRRRRVEWGLRRCVLRFGGRGPVDRSGGQAAKLLRADYFPTHI